MTHTYSLSGLTCSGCVAKVKSELLKDADITSAEVTLDPQQAVISMSRHIPIKHLQQVVRTAGNYNISDQGAHSSKKIGTADESTSNWFTTYKPILLIFAFIAGISLFTSYHEGSIHTMMFMTTFMAGFFLVFSFFKFLDLRSFARSYAMYDILAMKVPAYGWIYPFIELGLGLLFLSGLYPIFANWATLIVMGFSSIGVIQSVLSRKKIRCACLGAVFNFPMSTVTIIEDLLMVGMAGVMLILN